jgi:hypothetical protein
MSPVESVKDHFPIINNSVSTPGSVLFSRKPIIDVTGIVDVQSYMHACIELSLYTQNLKKDPEPGIDSTESILISCRLSL